MATNLPKRSRSNYSRNGKHERDEVPNASEAERALLGCVVLAANECAEKVLPFISAETFNDVRHQLLCRVIQEMHRNGATIDTVTLHGELSRRGCVNDCGGVAYVSGLPEACVSTANVSAYLAEILKAAATRQAMETAEALREQITRFPDQTASILKHTAVTFTALHQQVTQTATESARAKAIGSLKVPQPSADGELLKRRYLCRGAGLLLIGQSGQGKSSLAMQMAALWSLGRPCFGITPAQPLRVLLVQAENDDGDLFEMFDGICNGLKLLDDERRLAGERIKFYTEDSQAGDELLTRTLSPLLSEHRPDLLVIDPALAYIPGDTKDAEVVGRFLRRGLNPLLHKFGCAALIVHHTTKQRADGPQATSDFLYAGSGSTEFTNWARAVLALETKSNGCYRLHAPKRGARLGWADADGNPLFDVFIRHTRKPGAICWEALDSADVEDAVRIGKTKRDLLAHVPVSGAIAQTVLIEKAAASGLGQKKSRAFLDELLSDGTLHLWLVRRPGTNPEKRIARSPQPALL